MPHFRKKPVVIEAVRWSGVPAEADAVFDLVTDPAKQVISRTGENLTVTTLEGAMSANPGDWIIKGVQGELYPCKPDIFAATYEQVQP